MRMPKDCGGRGCSSRSIRRKTPGIPTNSRDLRLAGDVLGTVSGLRPGAAQDLLLVDTPAATVMVPFVSALVPTVDVDGGVVVIDPPPGLFDDHGDDEGNN